MGVTFWNYGLCNLKILQLNCPGLELSNDPLFVHFDDIGKFFMTLQFYDVIVELSQE